MLSCDREYATPEVVKLRKQWLLTTFRHDDMQTTRKRLRTFGNFQQSRLAFQVLVNCLARAVNVTNARYEGR